MAFPISQIDFNSYSISISSDKDSGLSAIVIYGQDDDAIEDDGENKKKKRRRKQNIRLGTLCSHFLKLFLVQFSQSRPFQSHINMSLFNGFQGKIRDGLKLSMAKIIENCMCPFDCSMSNPPTHKPIVSNISRSSHDCSFGPVTQLCVEDQFVSWRRGSLSK